MIRMAILLACLIFPLGLKAAETENSLTKKYLYPKYKGKSVRLADGTIADLVTKDISYEVDFYNKWYEAIGQSQHYARISGKKPGVILIVKPPFTFQKFKKVVDCAYICGKNGIVFHYELIK